MTLSTCFNPKAPQKGAKDGRAPSPAAKRQPGRSCAESKDEEIGGERILLALHHRSPTTSIFCYTRGIKHPSPLFLLRPAPPRDRGRVAAGWSVAEGSVAFDCPATQLEIWGIPSPPIVPPSKGQLAPGRDALIQRHLSPPVTQYYSCTLF